MNDDIRPNGGEGNRDARAAGSTATDRAGDVTSTYTDISGRPAFVIATVDHEDAWLAVPPDVVVDTDELR